MRIRDGLQPGQMLGTEAQFARRHCINRMTVRRALNRTGRRVPEDISVLGVDNSPTFAELCPDISTLQYPMSAVAERCLAVVRGKHDNGPAGRYKVVERRTVLGPSTRRRIENSAE